MLVPLAILAAVVLAAAAARRLFIGSQRIEGVTVRTPTDDTKIGADGAVRSIQGAEIVLPEELLGELWSTQTLERLARTYWSFLSHATLGIVRVYYTERERYVCVLARPFKLLTFGAPEYETDADRGIVRWRIVQGLLVASAGRSGDGYLEIDVQRMDCDVAGQARIHVEVEVANFYPAIASRLGRFLYANTQSRIHVIVTHGFLRRLARRDLEESVTGRFREVPEGKDTPPPQRERDKA
ncbi:hypothetical protein FSW04_08835 [Baekduia soli]|uniref:DUF1990 domain-containing protein n=1 Tax=Baekduia soli TaxID=496014 RepID=A0A5B8U3S5_9ACTN|nr:hypothetical protein [Baekduia soli]QEC47667.1 hypothetical protein FSW04_08835 [Baekduia soli]